MPQRMFTDDQEAELVRRYEAGESSASLSAEFGCNICTVPYIVRKLGGRVLEPADWMKRAAAVAGENRRLFNDDDRRAIVDDYESGLVSSKIATKYNCSEGAITRAIKEGGGIFRDKFSCGRKRELANQDFFDCIDSEEKAWALGFFTADGYVHDATRQLVIGLQRRDRDALETFRRLLGSTANIVDYEAATGKGDVIRSYSKITFNSKRLTDALLALGVTRAKSLIVEPWSGPDGLLRHYWRGAVDGDGSIFESKKEQKWSVSFCGNKMMVDGFMRFVSRHVESSAQKHPHFKIFSVTYRGRALPQEVARLLYDGSTVHLERKKRLADHLLTLPRRHSGTRQYR
jgi:hypothetical protein